VLVCQEKGDSHSSGDDSATYLFGHHRHGMVPARIEEN
jgi:hypothetical protein